MAQAQNIRKHFQGLRVEPGRRASRRDPFAETFDDDSDDKKSRSRSKKKQSPPAEKEKQKPSPVAPAKPSVSLLPSAADLIQDDFLNPPRRPDRRPSPAPAQLPLLRVSDGAGRRGSLDKGLQSKGLHSRIGPGSKAPRSAVALAAGNLAYLDDSDSDEVEVSPQRINRYPSPAPRKKSDPTDGARRASTPKGSREPTKDAFQAGSLPSAHTVASPFAGTKYLQDSESDEEDDDDDEEAVGSRSNSLDETATSDVASVSGSPDKHRVEIKRVDKSKQNGGGVSWRAFSAGRAEQRNTELESIQTRFKQRGKSISFGTHAITDDGNRVPVAASPEQIFGGSRGRKPRGKSPPRRAEDVKPTEDEVLDGGPVGIYDPTQFKTNPFTELAPIQTGVPNQQHNAMAMINDLRMASLTSGSTISPTNSDGPASPIDTGGLENSTGSLTGKMIISPPKTIPEGRLVDLSAASPVLSPTEDLMISPLSRNSSARSMRMSRPTRIPIAHSRRPSRRSTSANASVSPAHAFLSSWSVNAAASEPAPEPTPDDEGQAIGLNNEYIIGRTIGQGGFGVVKEVHTINAAGESTVRAVKIVRKNIPGRNDLENDKAQQELEHEVSIWRHLKHRHILDLYAVYDTDFATFCVMDLNVGGTLFEMVRTSRGSASENDGRKGLDSKIAKSYAYQLASALRYLHEDIRVCHRDVKLENCLIDMSEPNAEIEGGNLRLCDFGLADFLHSEAGDDGGPELIGRRFQRREPATQHPTTSSVIGTLEYASPKGLSVNRKLFETAGDVWAYGVIVYALCTGELPFRHPMPAKTVEMILQSEWDETMLANVASGNDIKELVQGCFEKDVDLRLTIGEALRSTWFEGCKEALGEEEEDRIGEALWQ